MPRIRSKTLWDQLAAAALAARRRAHAPYSRFKVGAALLAAEAGGGPMITAGGPTIISGCNVENVSYGGAICAERGAICSAVAAGHKRFAALAVATSAPEPAPPCGLCLQVLAEFCDDDLEILLVNTSGERRKTRLGRLLPRAFRRIER